MLTVYILVKVVNYKSEFSVIVKGRHEHEAKPVINPRRACAARVTVLCLFVCPSVCLSVCYNTPGLSNGQNAEISTSTKCR